MTSKLLVDRILIRWNKENYMLGVYVKVIMENLNKN